jgi:hypothetical protein
VEEGNLIEVIQGTVKAKFIDNSKAGKLFVITGRVQNNHSGARNFLSVTGKIFTKSKGKAPARAATVFCGNVLSGLDLSNMDLPTITKQLKNRVGAKASNMNVQPNATVPFMVVFSGLPADLEEFTVEAGTSVSAE